MKRLLFSIALAIAIHGLIFCFNGERLKNRIYPQVRLSPVTISLTYLPSADTAAESQYLRVVEKKTGRLFERQVSRPELQGASTQTDITAAGVTEADAVRDSLQSSVDKGYQVRDLKNGLEDLKQTYNRTAGEVPHIPQIIKEAVPLYKENPIPIYPMPAKKRGHEGTVILEVLVTKEGKAGKVSVFQSSRYSLLDESAVSSVEKWRFEPGKRGDEKVDMPVKIPIRFQLEAD